MIASTAHSHTRLRPVRALESPSTCSLPTCLTDFDTRSELHWPRPQLRSVRALESPSTCSLPTRLPHFDTISGLPPQALVAVPVRGLYLLNLLAHGACLPMWLVVCVQPAIAGGFSGCWSCCCLIWWFGFWGWYEYRAALSQVPVYQ